MLGMAQRRRFGVVAAVFFANVGVAENVEALGVGGHEAVFDAIVDHFYEMAGAVRAAMEIAVLRGAGGFVAAWQARGGIVGGRQSREDWVERLDNRVFAADHLAI